jgi:la-related protein 1
MAGSTFSYAQAAKGLSTPVAANKPTSDAATTAKEPTSTPANGPVTSAPSWAEEADSESQVDQPTPTPEATSKESFSKPTPPTPSVETPDISSPDLGASSASTVTKDDDVQSLPNGSSDSTWDNKSQASTSVANSLESGDKTSEKGKKGKNTVKIEYQEAPLPAVNIWKKRAEEQKAKAPKSTTAPLANGVTHGSNGPQPKRSDSGLKARPSTSDGRTKGHDESRLPQNRRDLRAEPESRKDTKGKTSDKESKQTSSTLPPPPARDQESWPTPEIAIDEDRKKIHEKSEKGEKDRKDNTLSGTQGKHEWVKVPYTPSVVFNTPLPNAANTRRGGRPGGRGAAQTNGRASGSAANGVGQPEKDVPAPAAVSNSDQSRRERVEGGAPHDASPKSKRTGSASSLPLNSQVPASPTEKLSKAAASEVESRSRGGSLATESAQPTNQNGTFSRQYPNRSNKPRRGEFSGGGERKRDGESSPTKDKTLDDRRIPAAALVDAPEDVERRASAYNEGANGYQHKHGRYGSYSGGRERERGRGGSRGGRGSFTNGHQYTNGHTPLLPQSTAFSMGPRSPPTFYPENPSYFTPPQSKYGRSNHRSHSVTSDAYRFSPYQGGPQIAPLQTYNMYDYNMMQQPMSAVPYTPYVDQSGLCAMLTTQLYVFCYLPPQFY